MKTRDRIANRHLSIAAGLVALLILPSLATAETSWLVRVDAAWVDPDFDIAFTDSGQRIQAKADANLGLGVTGEYLFTKRIGLEFGLLGGTQNDVNLRVSAGNQVVTAGGDTSVYPWGLGVNFHITPGKRADVYAGVRVAHVQFSDLTFSAAGETLRFKTDDDTGIGGILGVDIPVGKRDAMGFRDWFLNASLSYLQTELKVTGDDGFKESFDWDPLTWSFGVGYRF